MSQQRFHPWTTSFSAMKPLLAGASALLVIRTASLVLGFVGSVLVVRWLGAEQAGIYLYCLSVIGLFAGITNFGLARTALRFVAQYRASDQTALLMGIIQTSHAITLIASTLAAVAGFIYVGYTEIDPAWRNSLFVAFATVPFAALVVVNIEIAVGHGWVTLAYAPDQLLRTVLILGGLGGYLLVIGPANSTVANIVVLLAYATILVYQLFEFRRRAANTSLVKPQRQARLWLAISLPFWFGALADLLRERIDILLIGHNLPPGEVAVYGAASRTAALAILVQYAVTAPANSRVAALYARGNLDELADLMRHVKFWTIWPSFALVLALALAGPTILRLFAPEFSRGETTFYILLFGQLLAVCMGPGYMLLTLTGHQTAMMSTTALAATTCAALNALLIPLAGIEGAAVATAISIAFRGALLAFLSHRYLGIRTALSISRRRERSTHGGGAVQSRLAAVPLPTAMNRPAAGDHSAPANEANAQRS